VLRPLPPRLKWLRDAAPVAAVLTAPLAAPPWSALALAAGVVLWLALRPARREAWIAGLGLTLAVAFLVAGWVERLQRPADEAEWAAAARVEYAALWRGLWQEAAAAATALGQPPEDAGARLAAFRRLADLPGAGQGSGRRALLLLDPDGTAVAWAGEGLLHELRPEQVPRSGPHFVAGFNSATLLAVRPLGGGRRPWRVIAGASFASDRLPFDLPSLAGGPLRWALVADRREAAAGTVLVAPRDVPPMAVSRRTGPRPEQDPGPAERLAWAAGGLALLALAVARSLGLVLPASLTVSGLLSPAAAAGAPGGLQAAPPVLGRTSENRAGGRVREVFLPVLGGSLALAAAAGARPAALALLALGLCLAALGLRSGSSSWFGGWRWWGESPAAAAARGAAAVLLLFAATALLQERWGPLDLAAGLRAAPHIFVLRLAGCAAAFGLLALAGSRRAAPGAADRLAPAADRLAPVAVANRLAPGVAPDAAAFPPESQRWAWAAAALLVAGSTVPFLPALAVALLAAGGAAAAVWMARRPPLGLGGPLAALGLLALLAAGGVAEAAYRLRLERYAAGDLLRRLAPPTEVERRALSSILGAHFATRDLAELVPRRPAGLERQDLAFALWRNSPLAQRNTLSALIVDSWQGGSSSFSFGMPLVPGGWVDTSPTHREDLSLPLWEEALIEGEAQLTFDGSPWATARYWLVPRPGFETAERKDLEEVEVGLLRGGPAAGPVGDLPWPLLYALYSPDGRAALSPWEEAPPLDPALRGAGGLTARSGRTTTPAGRARAFVRRAAAGWEVVYLPDLTPAQALERAGTLAVSVLFLLAGAAAAGLLFALPRPAFRGVLRRAVRSYSKRLLIVYTLLLLVPLLLLNAVLVRSIEERLVREQRAAGEAALNSAQKSLGDLILALEPGFGIDTALDDTRLADLSELVHHEVNLYWGSSVYASSKHELFTAGLLPKRIPGEIYSRLALLGYDLTSRINRAGQTEYLELYAPLRVPGVPPAEERLFLSMPLLAQQEEAARELVHLRRRGVLVTTALFVLLIAVGTRLARNFTQPLQQLVEGTRRIAAGARSLDLAPSDLELAALVEAVDEMARRIAEGREKLLREKQVVERVVENVTSGVVSLDRDRRVLLYNRAAAELLGVAAGDRLEEVVGRTERLAPVAAFLRASTAGERAARETVRLAGPDGDVGSSAEPGGDQSEREWTLLWVPLPGEGEPSALLVVEDATEVLRGQRLLAWAEMARIIAHEIKNPLTPIRLSAEHMREVYANDPEHFGRVFERCTVNILAQVEELRSIASEFSAYSAIPRIEPRPGDLTAAITELVEGYRAAPPEGVSVELETDGPLPARFDAKLLGRAVRNLLENALRASAGGGTVLVRLERLERLERTETGQIPIAGRTGPTRMARIAVLDRGPGVKPELLPRIFDPYFSTHDTGTGLGLPIARRIAEEHGGGITARNRPEGGLEVAITVPLSEGPGAHAPG
jgi:nitrogen-specific signal transduction histidine kinase